MPALIITQVWVEPITRSDDSLPAKPEVDIKSREPLMRIGNSMFTAENDVFLSPGVKRQFYWVEPEVIQKWSIEPSFKAQWSNLLWKMFENLDS